MYMLVLDSRALHHSCCTSTAAMAIMQSQTAGYSGAVPVLASSVKQQTILSKCQEVLVHSASKIIWGLFSALVHRHMTMCTGMC